MNEGIAVLEHLNFFNKVINEFLAVDIKIDEENKVLILPSLLSQSYDHIIITMIYGKKTLILDELTSTLLSNEVRKIQIKNSRQDRIWWLGKKRKRRRKKRSRFVKGMSLFSQGRSLKE